MTKFILHGGYSRARVPNNKAFFSEMLKGVAEPATVLAIYFAAERSRWPGLFIEEQKQFTEAAAGRKFAFILADDDPKILEQQLRQAQVWFIRGGTSKIILDSFPRLPNFRDLFSGKIIGATSAGAYFLARYFYSDSRDKICEGFGILPIKIICHYTPVLASKVEALKAWGEDLPVYTLPETEFVIIEQ